MSPKYKLGAINLSSSVDPEKLSTTVSGLILSLSAGIIYLAARFGVHIDTAQISFVAVQVGGVVGALATIYGIIRKLVVFWTEVKPQAPQV